MINKWFLVLKNYPFNVVCKYILLMKKLITLHSLLTFKDNSFKKITLYYVTWFLKHMITFLQIFF